MSKKHVFSVLSLIFVATLIGCAHEWLRSQSPVPVQRSISSEQDIYHRDVQNIFNFRCVACHSCAESPCQLNLQSYEGLIRGDVKENVYGSSRPQSTMPKRMFEDAQTTSEWRAKGFHDVLGNPVNSVLLKVMEMGASHERTRVTQTVEKSLACYSQQTDPKVIEKNPEVAMPYGLPGLASEDIQKIRDWMKAGSPSPEKKNPVQFSSEIRDQVSVWNQFFNAKDLKARITSRYLYEHLFLAHLYFDESPREFLKLIRSSTSCENPTVIATRTPNTDPGFKEIYYCLVRELGTIVAKNHMPYRLSSEKLSWFKSKFWESNWKPTQFPSYEPEIATNPFRAYREMPVKVRYEFLLEDARYHIMTFIKGPVCHGSVALNSIQEQFFVFFMNPESDLMVRSPSFAQTFEKTSNLPGQWGDQISVVSTLPAYAKLLGKRNEYREVQNIEMKRLNPAGLKLEDIWDGNGKNPNAVLTVFRHDDNAAVVTGAQGDLAKTIMLLDYSVFERLAYNLVVNFDVYSGIGHQFLTRLYMDLIRMDAENNYLNFLPQKDRAVIKNQWYKGLLTQLKLLKLNERQFPDMDTRISFTANADHHLEMIKKILFERMSPQVLSVKDSLNWKKLANSEKPETLSKADELLKTLTSIQARTKPFPNFFPEVTYLFVGADQVYSIIRNREHSNISWLTNESARLAPEEDSLTIREGFMGFYPNLFMYVDPQNLESFVRETRQMTTNEDYQFLMSNYGVDRMDPRFWSLYDKAYENFIKTSPIEAGFIDLSHYKLNKYGSN